MPWRTAIPRRVLGLLLACLGGAILAGPAHAAAVKRTAILVLENRSYDDVVDEARAPFLSDLARRGALATRYYALRHPSLPNYLALTTGSTWGLKRNCRACRFDHPSLFGQLDHAHVSWRGYFENLPHNELRTTGTALYDPHYNPLVYLRRMRRSAADRARIANFAALETALRTRRLPRFSWIAPNVVHDGHTGSLEAADRFAAQLVPRVLRALGPRGLLYITWDESDIDDVRGTGGGHVALIALGPRARHRTRLTQPANHYALLRTIEHSFRLPTLEAAGWARTPLLTGLLR